MLFVDLETMGVEKEAMAYFNPKAVKTGNLKDEAKIAAKIEDERSKVIAKAALNPMTARVITIQYAGPKGDVEIISGDERAMLAEWWEMIADKSIRKAVNWTGNTHWRGNFDAKMLYWRSLKLGLRPAVLLDWENLTSEWAKYDSEPGYYNLENVARFLDLEVEDTSPVKGSNFAEHWLAKNPKAETYAKQDVELLRKIYFRLKGMES